MTAAGPRHLLPYSVGQLPKLALATFLTEKTVVWIITALGAQLQGSWPQDPPGLWPGFPGSVGERKLRELLQTAVLSVERSSPSGTILSPRGHVAMSGGISGCHDWAERVPLASSGLRLETLLNILQCPRLPHLNPTHTEE